MSSYNINLSYWDVQPADRVVRPFSALYDLDKSKNKKQSSTIMWALKLLTDPSKDNPLSRMTREERIDELTSTFLPQSDLDKVLSLEEEYKNNNLSYIKRRYVFYQNMLEAREKFMASLTYESNANQLDSMLEKTKKIWDEFLKIKKELDVEEATYHTKGNREESAGEKGLI